MAGVRRIGSGGSKPSGVPNQGSAGTTKPTFRLGGAPLKGPTAGRTAHKPGRK
jgi:hypothetical protein